MLRQGFLATQQQAIGSMISLHPVVPMYPCTVLGGVDTYPEPLTSYL